MAVLGGYCFTPSSSNVEVNANSQQMGWFGVLSIDCQSMSMGSSN
jgi:hypothetical protein